MNISDLNHLETIAEAPNVIGGWSYSHFFSNWFQGWFTNHSIRKYVVSESYTPDGTGSAVAIIGKLNNGATFAYARASSKSSSSVYATASIASGAITYSTSMSEPGFQNYLDD